MSVLMDQILVYRRPHLKKILFDLSLASVEILGVRK